jgi:alpha-glucoside transport system substrate-binding protein
VKRKSLLFMVLAALVAALAVAAAGCGGGDEEGDGGEAGGERFTGTITILSLWGGSEAEAFREVLNGFTQKTNIKTKYEQAEDFETVIRTRLAAGNPPMVAIIPRPGPVQDWALAGDLQTFEDIGVNMDAINENYAQGWIDLGTVEDQLYGIPVKANSKSVVWYKPKSFQQLGVEPPTDWQGLLDITEKYKAQGKTPWTVGAGDSWTLTDWFEILYLRTAGPDKYSQLFGGELEFTDQSVVDALNEMLKILNDDNLVGGVEGALGTKFVSDIGQVYGENAKADLYFEGGFVGGIALKDVNPKLKIGQDIDFFEFPVVNEEVGDPLLGAGDLVVAFESNDGVRQLIDYLASKEAAETWAGTGAIVSPNKSASKDVYPNELAVKEAEQLTGAEEFRFDGSDLLPGALAEDWGALLQNIIKNPGDMQSQLEEFESSAAAEFGR